ncbi:hypothetical protein H2199_003354 [Coniosporium tulheliwenetii]|uniref:Uncharacterized protein n=1 Tax=Coniosporium tulheliwenetii TaxID=3383036 RepID=A0ACC2ZDD2_9PEZI|nr:hypothetical protein H2199_003354 [Cladosporium sp. JES 115]
MATQVSKDEQSDPQASLILIIPEPGERVFYVASFGLPNLRFKDLEEQSWKILEIARKIFRVGLFRKGRTQIVPSSKEFVEIMLLKHREIPINFGEKTPDKLHRNTMRWQLFGKIPVLVLPGGVKQEPDRFGGDGWHLIPVLKRLLLLGIIQ